MKKVGIIEGFYGEPYSNKTHESLLKMFKEWDMDFYIYAPKASRALRKDWLEDFPEEEKQVLTTLRGLCEKHNVRFGIGLSPFEIFQNFDTSAKSKLENKIKQLEQYQLDILAILFDDMQGNQSDLAQVQANIMIEVQKMTSVEQLIMCPTYYTDSERLDELFGERPANYLEDLGELLPQKIEVFWTGEKICSKTYPVNHLKRVAKQLKRKPFIWDNYPVNDGPRMCKHLHLSEFDHSHHDAFPECSGWAINPMNQGHLSMLPIDALMTNKNLRESLKKLAPNLKDVILNNLELLHQHGLDEISKEKKQELKSQLGTDEFSIELKRWLDGEYIVGDECMTN